MQNTSIATINDLPLPEKREIYHRLIPPEMLEKFNLNPFLVDTDGNDLLVLDAEKDSSDTEISVYHQKNFKDPVLYGHMTDTINGQIHILLYIMNDPHSPRFDVDRMPDGSSTGFGILQRNLMAETDALNAGLLPGQVRQGMHLLSKAIDSFEKFVQSLGHSHYFAEPLYYHNAIIFERYGFKYQSGKRLMEEINLGFGPKGNLSAQLDGSIFRAKNSPESIRLRSWAIHDGILGKACSNVTMYKAIKDPAGLNTAPGISW